LDKRIVEFGLGIPPELYVKNGYSRYIFRLAVGDLLPETVRWSHVKRESRRIARFLEISKGAAHKWLRQAEGNGLLSEPNPYINTQSLQKQAWKGSEDMDETTYITTMVRSIQVLVACIENQSVIEIS
jgi:asparagine synthase (glutamine-hydrolysing)